MFKSGRSSCQGPFSSLRVPVKPGQWPLSAPQGALMLAGPDQRGSQHLGPQAHFFYILIFLLTFIHPVKVSWTRMFLIRSIMNHIISTQVLTSWTCPVQPQFFSLMNGGVTHSFSRFKTVAGPFHNSGLSVLKPTKTDIFGHFRSAKQVPNKQNNELICYLLLLLLVLCLRQPRQICVQFTFLTAPSGPCWLLRVFLAQ